MTPLPISEALAAMSIEALQDAWQATFGSPAPANFKPEMLARSVAWRAQINERGDLPATVLCDLAMRAAQVSGSRAAVADKPEKPLPSVALKTGTRLVRTWQGTTHAVDIAEGVYFWRGERYRSLSAIAKKITGTHWNGPLFFGLRDRRDWERTKDQRRGAQPARRRKFRIVKEVAHG